MALDDPNITKIIFEKVGDWREVTVKPDTISRLACVAREKDKWHVEIIDLAPGIFTIDLREKNGKLYFETMPRKSFLPKKNKPSHIRGRYS